jgi:Spy/CpxP family protein refolding chaperone
MRRAWWVALAVVLLAAVAGSVLYGQASGTAAAPAPSAGTRPVSAERVQAMLDRLDLSAEDRAAVEKSLPVLLQAREALQEELGKLRTVADDASATSEQIAQAIDKYSTARRTYRQAARTEDRALRDKLSPRGQARCLVAGILDNGLGFGRGVRTGTGRRSGG